ncbi:hypothetical protein MGYG_02189 [Nannizzia gypsea CBS 118893]|uniref:CFEM domain-containing protein n=1 Tax=Arthroderma gypseum (strain ATCC MYA-4604 / CBS 118893) TaxID=535722 RepID=E4UQ94_ARTGP|nr:hypothetical protein MGYG_02189 [Nannizzia gypsea CBS 118893]EFQ99175.1 hypothetical protein MGYG_02189 [Nannizzia gypsea CBS 118893]
MKLSIFLPVTMLAAAALAVDLTPINNLPPCPKNCVYSGIGKSKDFGCSFPSPQCLCRNRAYQQYLHNCAQKCTPAERDQMRQAGTKLCVDAAIPTGLPTGLPNLPIPTAIPTLVPTAIPTLIPTAIPTLVPTAIPTAIPPWATSLIPPIPSLPSIPGLPSLPSLPSIPGIPPIPTPAANEMFNQAKASPNSRVMRVKQEA